MITEATEICRIWRIMIICIKNIDVGHFKPVRLRMRACSVSSGGSPALGALSAASKLASTVLATQSSHSAPGCVLTGGLMDANDYFLISHGIPTPQFGWP